MKLVVNEESKENVDKEKIN